MMRWIYLSPHFDDVVLSCGGLIWDQVQAGQPVESWTICAGVPTPGKPFSDFAQQLHKRWETGPEAVPARRQEDDEAVDRLGAVAYYWDLPDCIYRQLPDGSWLVNGEEDLWKPVHPLEEPVVQQLTAWLVERLRPDDHLVSPMTLGSHVDHHLTRAAAERAANQAGCALFYYADYPYAVKTGSAWEGKLDLAWNKACFTVSPQALAAWQEAVGCYRSQISTFWGGLEEMHGALAKYWRAGGGACLWEGKPAALQM